MWLILTLELKYSSKEKGKKKKVELILKQGIKAPLQASIGSLKKISCLLFLLLFGDKKRIACKSSFDLYFHLFNIEFFWFA